MLWSGFDNRYDQSSVYRVYYATVGTEYIPVRVFSLRPPVLAVFGQDLGPISYNIGIGFLGDFNAHFAETGLAF